MTIGEKIKFLRKKKGMSQEDLASMLHTTKQAVYKYENNIVTNIPMDKIEVMGTIFGVSPSYLMGWEDKVSEKIDFNSLGIRPILQKRFPMLGEIACGKPIFANEDHEAYVDASADIDADFCLTARGDSMTGAGIKNGDVVFIKQRPVVDNGEIAAVIIDGEATLKYWFYYHEKQKLVLNPANTNYEPLVYVGAELDEITCLGKAVCYMSKL